MSKSYAILVGVDEAAGLPPCAHAAAAVVDFALKLERVGFAKSEQFVLTGPLATRSALESRLRKVSKLLQPDDTIWFVFAGPSFTVDSRTYLACADTLSDDLEATALPLAGLVQSMRRPDVALRLWLDTPALLEHEMQQLFAPDGPNLALTACSEGETSHAAKGRRLWLELAGEALAGAAPAALENDRLTGISIISWFQEELPRAIRKSMAIPGGQSPQVFGNRSGLLAEVQPAPVPATAKLDLKKLKRIVFRGERRDRVKNLSGVQPGFELPKSASPSAQKWTYKLASEDLKRTVETTFNALRENLGFKRKDLETTIESDGLAIIRTPKFDYAVSVSLDPNDVSSVTWRHEVSQIASAEILRSEGFRTTFGSRLSTLEFEFEKAIDVEALVDRIEADPPPGVSVRVASDGTACDVNVQGFPGKIHVERSRLRIEGRPGATPDSLVEQFFEFHQQFGGKKGLPRLKG